jgi:hypothetical protein
MDEPELLSIENEGTKKNKTEIDLLFNKRLNLPEESLILNVELV